MTRTMSTPVLILAVLLPTSALGQGHDGDVSLLAAAAAHARTVVPEGPFHIIATDFPVPGAASAVAKQLGASVGPPNSAVNCTGPFGRCKAAPARGVIELTDLRRPTATTAIVRVRVHAFPDDFEGEYYAQTDDVHLSKANGRWTISRVVLLSQT